MFFRTDTAETSGPPLDRRSEGKRLVFLAFVAAWLLHPFATNRQVGTGDALWYANMLADFCLQWRAGIFPVWVGQTEFAFNGAIYPLRVAPLYQHLGGVLDLITGRQLSWFALQHLCVIVCGLAGIFTSYFTLVTLAPGHRWPAVGFAALYLGCPGVLGTIYTQDLYMTWMTVPFLPLAVYGTLRTFNRDDVASQIWLVAPLAALWYAHTPVALWGTMLAAAAQGFRLLAIHRSVAAWKRAALGVIVFIALVHYPFVSVASLQLPRGASAVTSALTEQERVTNVIREVFPAVLKPLSENARALSDLQLGYSLWLVLIAAVAIFAAKRDRRIGVLLAACVILLLLLLPVPVITDWAWASLPEQIKRITFYWPMHRFYLLLGAILAATGALALRAVWTENVRRQKLIYLMLGIACAWSLFESRQFVRAGAERTATAAASASGQRPENLLLMNHAYGLFSALPAYFSNGVMNPRREARLMEFDTWRPLPGGAPRPLQTGWFQGTVDANPGVLNLEPRLRLEPGRDYELRFAFSGHNYQGVLQLVGTTFFREYVLPSSGEALSFGSGPANDNTLSLWTTNPAGEEIMLRFIPTTVGVRAAEFRDFARFTWSEVDHKKSAVEVTSLLPFTANIRVKTKAWLETPRMFMHGYHAQIDGSPAELRTSPDNLVAVELSPGEHRVEVTYTAPVSLRISYYAALTIWLSLTAILLRRMFRSARQQWSSTRSSIRSIS